MTTIDPAMIGSPARWIRSLASIGAVVLLILVAMPLVARAPWSEVGTTITAVPSSALLLLGALWAAGLLAHTITLMAALPRLSRLRALTLSLTGSAVANVLPFGGAAGIALNYRMTRSWGFDRPAFAVYTVVTNLWDVLIKLCLPVLALGWLVAQGDVTAGRIVTTASVATLVLALVSLAGLAMVVSDRAAGATARAADRGARAALRLIRSEREVRVAATINRLRHECRALVVARWPRLTTGLVMYTILLAILLWGCLHVTGAGLSPAVVFAAFSLERVLTLAGVTPGGAGVVEVGLVGLLIAAGGDPVGSVAGTMLYRTFTYGLEIPVGGLGLVAWLLARRRAGRAAVGTAALERAV